ncbi:MAG: hypothetical protein ACRD1L_04155, partial [Terriglobales bacterium]
VYGAEDAREGNSDAAPVPAPAPYVPPRPPVATRPPEEALDLLQRILAPLRGTNPRPLYLRNVKQLLRAEAPGFDEQQHGFASLVDLLRAGQSQNWLRLQRDRRGALRVFIPPTPGAAPSAPPAEGELNYAAREPGNRADTPRPSPGGEMDERQPGFLEGGNGAAPAVAAARAPGGEPEDSQIAVLGYYDGIHGEGTEEQPLSLAAAVADGGVRKKRGPRKPKPDGGGPNRRRKPKH